MNCKSKMKINETRVRTAIKPRWTRCKRGCGVLNLFCGTVTPGFEENKSRVLQKIGESTIGTYGWLWSALSQHNHTEFTQSGSLHKEDIKTNKILNYMYGEKCQRHLWRSTKQTWRQNLTNLTKFRTSKSGPVKTKTPDSNSSAKIRLHLRDVRCDIGYVGLLIVCLRVTRDII